MYIKVCPQNSNDHWMFECDRFIHEDIRDKDRLQSESSNTYRILKVDNADEEKLEDEISYNYSTQLWLYQGSEIFIAHLLIDNAVIYVMSDDGKTIDTILT